MPPTYDNITYIKSLPKKREHAYGEAKQKWNTGVTFEMLEGNRLVIEVLKDILVKLANSYPLNHFNNRSPEKYFSTKISSIAEWHRNHSEPEGHGTGGTIVGVVVGERVIANLECMVSEMVLSLTSNRDDINYKAWYNEWIISYND